MSDSRPRGVRGEEARRAPVRRGLVQLFLVLAVALALVSAACRVMSGDLRRHPPQTCASCHREIAREWRRSAHARAFTDPTYLAATDGGRDTACVPCHAPSPLLEDDPGSPVRARAGGREHGVDCVACHFRDGAYAGRHAAVIGPHPMARDVTRLPCSSFCGRCHEAEHEEYRTLYLPELPDATERRSCGDCHMPTRASRLTQGQVLSGLHPRRMVHDHAFSTWTSDLPRQALAVSDPRIEHEAGSWRVAFSLTNRGAGHRIPTGAFGDRALRTTLDLLGDADRIVGHAEAALLAAKDEGLVPFRPTPFTLEVDVAPEDAVRVVRLRVYTTDEHRSFVFLLEERRWPVPASPDGS